MDVREKIEQTLPFVRQKPLPPLAPLISNSQPAFATSFAQKRPSSERPFDPWSLLEDYSDAPPSPSTHLNGEKMERKSLTYGNNLFKKRKSNL